VPEPGALVTRKHISEALEKGRERVISQRELIDWATMLLLNDAFQLDPTDEDLIAESLHRISSDFDTT
jgi:hypothetical protein